MTTQSKGVSRLPELIDIFNGSVHLVLNPHLDEGLTLEAYLDQHRSKDSESDNERMAFADMIAAGQLVEIRLYAKDGKKLAISINETSFDFAIDRAIYAVTECLVPECINFGSKYLQKAVNG